MMHALQPMHMSRLITMAPTSLRLIALTGHATLHGASSQCIQSIGMSMPSSSILIIFTLDNIGLNFLSFVKEQTISQYLHPVHKLGSIEKTFSIAHHGV